MWEEANQISFSWTCADAYCVQKRVDVARMSEVKFEGNGDEKAMNRLTQKR
jgi:hypothetical protein